MAKETKDRGCQAILAGIRKDKQRLDKNDPIDCYETDRAHWRSLWYHRPNAPCPNAPKRGCRGLRR